MQIIICILIRSSSFNLVLFDRRCEDDLGIDHKMANRTTSPGYVCGNRTMPISVSGLLLLTGGFLILDDLK